MSQLDTMATALRGRLLDALDAEVDSARAVAKAARAYGREDAATLTEELVKWVEAKRAAYRANEQESFNEADAKADAIRDQIQQKVGR